MDIIYLSISLLLIVICLLLWQQNTHEKKLIVQDQNSRVLQALLSYPVHEYKMDHMLHRCLAIILSAPSLNVSQKGAIFLNHNKQLKLEAQIGLSESNILSCSMVEMGECLCGQVAELKQFQYKPRVDKQHAKFFSGMEGHGHYLMPILSRGELLGVLNLYIEEHSESNLSEIKFVKAIGHALAGLIERKLIADQLLLGDSVITHSQQAIFITDKHNQIIRVNQACEDITGYSNEELVGKNPAVFRSDRQDESFYQQLWQAINSQGFWQGKIWNKHKNGTVFPEWLTISTIKDHNNEVLNYLAIFTDLSNIWQAEQSINQLAFYDALTGLPNRTLLADRTQQAIAQANRQKNQLALLCLDLDNFKNINDSLGRLNGDELLKGIASRIVETVRMEDSVARFGADEFAILIQCVNAEDDGTVIHIAEKVLNNIYESFMLEGHELHPSCSIGISCYPADADNTNDLIKYAESAMHQAKQVGRSSIQFYTENINQNAFKKLEIESALNQAMKQNELEVYFQPQIDIASDRVSGAEALLRWNNEQLGQVPPVCFIPVAEESGLIINLGEWVLKEVCKKIAVWAEHGWFGANFNRIAVNISPIQFNDHQFINRVEKILHDTQVPVEYLEMELTESSLQESTDAVIEKLYAIKKLGINIAIDDFGTGYSSLSRLKQFPIDVLKIDRSFVQDISEDSSDKAIVKAIVAMADALGLSVLAEGVETQSQLETIGQLNCQYYQGYHFSKAIESVAFESLISQAMEPST